MRCSLFLEAFKNKNDTRDVLFFRSLQNHSKYGLCSLFLEAFEMSTDIQHVLFSSKPSK